MPNCAFCGAELPNNARFCSNCGQVPRAIAEQTPNMQSPGSFPRVSGPQSQGRRPNWMGNVPPRWVIIGLAIIIVVASGLGILTAIARIHSTANNVGTPSTHTNPACPNQQSATCKPQNNNKTPIASTSTVNLLFSGAVTGRLTSIHITSCGAAGSNYDVNVQGKISGTQYDLVFKITAYKGAGTYNTGQMFSNLTQQPVSLTGAWVNAGNSPATATIDSNIKSGTMAITVAGTINIVHISGNWTCA